MAKPVSRITTVTGEVAADQITVALAAEPLLRSPQPLHGNAGIPATRAALLRAPVTIERLGALMMGEPSIDDATLDTDDAVRALALLAASASASGSSSEALVIAVADGEREDAAALAEASRRSGVALARATAGEWQAALRGEVADAPERADRTMAEIRERAEAAFAEPSGPAAAVGIAPIPAANDPSARAVLECLAVVAAANDAPLFIGVPMNSTPGDTDPARADRVTAPDDRDPLADLEAALAITEAAGVPRARTIVVGAARMIAARPTADRAAVGVDTERVAALFDTGAVVCFDDLGRIPNVSTVVSDHDVAVTIIDRAARGDGGRILLSSGIRHKHRSSAWGGNGLEFVPEQFIPYLRMCGADEALLIAVSGGNVLQILSRPSSLDPHEEIV